MRAAPLTMVGPIETWPSPAMTVRPFLRTARMVVPCQSGKEEAVVFMAADMAKPASCRKGAAARRRCAAPGRALRSR
ncbi:hypothetical protein FQZ97_1217730 [compost metagenome]